MHKNVWRFVAVCICGCLLASVVRAKVWLLPDYQSSQFYSRRVNGGNSHKSDNPVCSDYGMYTASQITTGMSCASSTMIKNLKCFGDCSCSSAYQYTSSSCRSAGKIPSGSSCMGKYRECICDTSTYPHTSSSCAYTLSGASCSDKYGYHYNSCVNPCAAYASYTNVSSCSYGCEDVVSTCTSKCRSCYADNCRNRADNETKLGCEKYWSDCPDKCQTGKTEAECDSGFHQSADKLSCVANACEGFTLSSCPSHASCSTCKTGTATKYKLDQCNSGYEISGSSCKAAACTGFSYSCISSATACETCQSGTTTKYRPTGCKEGYVLSSNTCSAVDCRGKGYTLYGCPSSAVSCAECLGGTSTYYKINDCKAGYELTDNSCAMVDCQGKGYTFYSCPSLAADCETCLRGTSTYYRIKNCQRPLSVSTDQKSCICPANAVVTDETSLRLAFSEKCPIITASGTINMTDTQQITIYPDTTKFTGINEGTLEIKASNKYSSFFGTNSSTTNLEINNLNIKIDENVYISNVLRLSRRPIIIKDLTITANINSSDVSTVSDIISLSNIPEANIDNLNLTMNINNTTSSGEGLTIYTDETANSIINIKNSSITLNNTNTTGRLYTCLSFIANGAGKLNTTVKNVKLHINGANGYGVYINEISGRKDGSDRIINLTGMTVNAPRGFYSIIESQTYNNFQNLTYTQTGEEISVRTY